MVSGIGNEPRNQRKAGRKTCPSENQTIPYLPSPAACSLIVLRIRDKLMQTYGVDSGIVTCRHSSANDRTRYTIHPYARKAILKRLLQLNHKLYAEEEATGVHKKKTGTKGHAGDDEQPSLL